MPAKTTQVGVLIGGVTSAAKTADEDFDTFLVRREKISSEYIQGKAAPLRGISTSSDPATFFPPNGDRVVGAATVNAANKKSAQAFGTGSVGRFEVLQSGSSGRFGFWTGLQHADMVMKGKKERVRMQLRITEVFRIERGKWKLVHRHADMGKAK